MFEHDLTSAVLSFKAKFANTPERVYSVHTSAVSTALNFCTVINVNAAVFITVSSKALTYIVINEVLHVSMKTETQQRHACSKMWCGSRQWASLHMIVLRREREWSYPWSWSCTFQNFKRGRPWCSLHLPCMFHCSDMGSDHSRWCWSHNSFLWSQLDSHRCSLSDQWVCRVHPPGKEIGCKL